MLTKREKEIIKAIIGFIDNKNSKRIRLKDEDNNSIIQKESVDMLLKSNA